MLVPWHPLVVRPLVTSVSVGGGSCEVLQLKNCISSRLPGHDLGVTCSGRAPRSDLAFGDLVKTLWGFALLLLLDTIPLGGDCACETPVALKIPLWRQL